MEDFGVEVLVSGEVLDKWRENAMGNAKVSVSNPKIEANHFGMRYVTYGVNFSAVRPDTKYVSLGTQEGEQPEKTEDGVRRRYSDFIWLRKTLSRCFPAILFPLLPPKKTFGNLGSEFVEDRRARLEEFMSRIVSRHQFIAQCRPFLAFVRKRISDFKDEKKAVDEVLQHWSPIKHLELYKRIFKGHEAFGKRPPMADPADMVHFMKTFLLDTQAQLTVLIKSQERLAKLHKSIANQKRIMCAALNIMGDQKVSRLQGIETPKYMEMGNRISKDAEQGDRQCNLSIELAGISIQEKEDTQAMLEIVTQWQRLHRYLDNRFESKDEQDAANRMALVELERYMTVLLFHCELPYYWSTKVKSFREVP
ncbi:hypothetical protein AAMO2058_000028700 [Amorphochlora amoebiformis]